MAWTIGPVLCDMERDACIWYIFAVGLYMRWASLVVQMVKCLPAMWETWVWSLGQKIPWRRHPTPVPLPIGNSNGQSTSVGYSPWGRRESDTTEWLQFPICEVRWLLKHHLCNRHTPFWQWLRITEVSFCSLNSPLWMILVSGERWWYWQAWGLATQSFREARGWRPC